MYRLIGRSYLCRAFVATILFSCSLIPAFAQTAPTTQEAGRAAVDAVTDVSITVSDLDRAVNFFTDVLTFEKMSGSRRSGEDFGRLQGLSNPAARTARLKLGDEFIELVEYESPRGQPMPADSRSNDRWFQHIVIIVSDMEKAHAHLHEKMVRHASKDPQRLPDWNKNAAGIKAFYFRDPDGHFLEILEFPPDKGNPKWHRHDAANGSTGEKPLFLGVDHTAIVVADTDASLSFYRDALGFKVVGGSENYGVEQEALNNVPGAHLRITTLRAARGPAVEFLQYVQPKDGRPYPDDARTNDILHWQTTLVSRNAGELVATLRARGVRFVSDRADRPDAALREFIVRDPDGHAFKIMSE